MGAALPESSCVHPGCKSIHGLPSNCASSPVNSPRAIRWLCGFLSSVKWKESGTLVKDGMGRRINVPSSWGRSVFRNPWWNLKPIILQGPLGYLWVTLQRKWVTHLKSSAGWRGCVVEAQRPGIQCRLSHGFCLLG